MQIAAHLFIRGTLWDTSSHELLYCRIVMNRKQLEPHRITKPIQLLATWLLALTILEGTFMTAAVSIDQPRWLRATIVLVALIFVPIFLALLFLLQTKFRPEMQEDVYFADYLERREQITRTTEDLRQSMNSGGLDLVSLAVGRSVNEVSAEEREEIGTLSRLLQELLRSWHRDVAPQVGVDPGAQLELGRALMAEHQWSEAAGYLDEYVSTNPADWQVHFSRGIAHANSRLGPAADQAALRAYNDAILFAPQDLDENMKGRLYIYRAAIAKRLGRLNEAEADLRIAEAMVSEPYEVDNLRYNLAAVYALMGKRSEVLELVASLRDSPQLRAVKSHLNDYFLAFRNDPEFNRLLV